MSFGPLFSRVGRNFWAMDFYLRTKQHHKADKRVDVPESVSDSDEELYLDEKNQGSEWHLGNIH